MDDNLLPQQPLIPVISNEPPTNQPSLINLTLFVILSALTSLFFWFSFGAGNISDYIVAYSVPRYPGIKNWAIYSTNGYPVTGPSANITFGSSHTAGTILNYYKNELEKRGWIIDAKYDYPNYKARIFHKSILGKEFSINVDKNESLYDLTQRSIIGVHHK